MNDTDDRRSLEAMKRELRHDLRTPVNAVLGLCQILLAEVDGPLGDEQRRQVQHIREAARSMAGLIDDRLAPDGERTP
jgi:signal transduction histidine kinase